MAKVSLDTFCLEMLSLGCTLVYGRQQSAFRAAKQTLGKGSSARFNLEDTGIPLSSVSVF